MVIWYEETLASQLSVGDQFWADGRLHTVRARCPEFVLAQCGSQVVKISPNVMVDKVVRYG